MQYCKVNLNLFHAQFQDLPYHPHLTLAFRDLKKQQYAEAVEFKNRAFRYDFVTDKIALLKHDGKHWNVFREFLLAS
jgi:2''-5'' RNA ligase